MKKLKEGVKGIPQERRHATLGKNSDLFRHKGGVVLKKGHTYACRKNESSSVRNREKSVFEKKTPDEPRWKKSDPRPRGGVAPAQAPPLLLGRGWLSLYVREGGTASACCVKRKMPVGQFQGYTLQKKKTPPREPRKVEKTAWASSEEGFFAKKKNGPQEFLEGGGKRRTRRPTDDLGGKNPYPSVEKRV